MKLKVNGEQYEHCGNGSVSALLQEMGADEERTALMINGKVIPSGNWGEMLLQEGDTIEVVVFVGGG